MRYGKITHFEVLQTNKLEIEQNHEIPSQSLNISEIKDKNKIGSDIISRVNCKI